MLCLYIIDRNVRAEMKSMMIKVQCRQILKHMNVVMLMVLFSMPCRVIGQGFDKPTSGQTVKFSAHDGFLLGGGYFAGAPSAAGVLILHDCSGNGKSYALLGEKLAMNGLHTLSLDLRGYGASETDEFSSLKIKSQSKGIVAYQDAVAGLTSYWSRDVLTAYNYLRTKVNKRKEIAIVTSGCSSNYAVSLAEKMHLNSMVLITPLMSIGDKERYKNLNDIPSYFISSTHHFDSHQTAKELFEWNGAKSSKAQIFKGNRVDSALLRSHKHVIDDIALWLKKNLEK